MIDADYVIVLPVTLLLWRNYNIMRTPSFPAESIRACLHAHKVATLPELKQALGTEVGMTVFRKLRELGYHSSYSHRGQYYTLDEIARFDEQGLWSHHGIWFSRLGSLLNSAESFVQISEAGYFSHELENLLHVSVKEALLQLVSERRLARVARPSIPVLCFRTGVAQATASGAAHDAGPASLARRRSVAGSRIRGGKGGHRAVLQFARRAATPPVRRTSIPAAGPRW